MHKNIKHNFVSIQSDYYESLNHSQLSAERSKSPLSFKKDKLNQLVMPCAPIVSQSGHRRNSSQVSIKSQLSRNSASPKPINISKVLQDRQVEVFIRDTYIKICLKNHKTPY